MDELKSRLETARVNAEIAYLTWKSLQNRIERYQTMIQAVSLVADSDADDVAYIIAVLDEMKLKLQ